ncbi:EAL domain-containing protein [Photobacterium damselae]|uniref:bifunctional diguanylate cyclase/phosphodiesterase n=1 Tax=Photobacterium damselae TaxID=38293 RepID=UPI00084B936C|nr:EAL domain-containing protein [Photobacterium damselae]OEC83199.1 hypothetical protein A9D46_12370 [Photobacterium damselae subsp. damselae]
MSLYKQCSLMLLGLLVFVFSIAGYFQLKEVKELVNNQLQAELVNTIHNISIATVTPLEMGDNQSIEQIITPQQPRNLAEIHLTSLVDGQVYQWQKAIEESTSVPSWFTQWIAWSNLEQQRTIKAGWLELASLTVSINPSWAYLQLWYYFLAIACTFISVVIAALLIMSWGWQRLMSRLDVLTLHTQQVAKHEKSHVSVERALPELDGITQAINLMAKQLNNYIQLSNQEIQSLRLQKQIDKRSGLANAEYFYDRMNSWLDEPVAGALAIIDCAWLEQIHEQYGSGVYQDSLRLLAQSLQKRCLKSTVLAQLNRSQLAIILTEHTVKEQQQEIQYIVQDIQNEIEQSEISNGEFFIGVSSKTDASTKNSLYQETLSALNYAQEHHQKVHWADNTVTHYHGLAVLNWATSIEQAITDRALVFKSQPIQNMATTATVQNEVFCQLQLGDERVMAKTFMPYVEEYGLGERLDQCILQMIEQASLLAHSGSTIAINLTVNSIRSSSFQTWLAHFLNESAMSDKLSFEVPESAIEEDLSACLSLALLFNQKDISWGIDHYGRQLTSVDYLLSLRPKYVKLDQSFAGVSTESGKYELGRALASIAAGLDIKVIATGIQYSEQLALLEGLPIWGYQGFIAPPVELNLA